MSGEQGQRDVQDCVAEVGPHTSLPAVGSHPEPRWGSCALGRGEHSSLWVHDCKLQTQWLKQPPLIVLVALQPGTREGLSPTAAGPPVSSSLAHLAPLQPRSAGLSYPSTSHVWHGVPTSSAASRSTSEPRGGKQTLPSLCWQGVPCGTSSYHRCEAGGAHCPCGWEEEAAASWGQASPRVGELESPPTAPSGVWLSSTEDADPGGDHRKDPAAHVTGSWPSVPLRARACTPLFWDHRELLSLLPDSPTPEVWSPQKRACPCSQQHGSFHE